MARSAANAEPSMEDAFVRLVEQASRTAAAT
jgi:hypothetical protein